MHNKYHSVWGLGASTHDPESVILDPHVEGVKVPIGKLVPSCESTGDLLYNEFVVYDAAQVMMRYLVEVKFDFIE